MFPPANDQCASSRLEGSHLSHLFLLRIDDLARVLPSSSSAASRTLVNGSTAASRPNCERCSPAADARVVLVGPLSTPPELPLAHTQIPIQYCRGQSHFSPALPLHATATPSRRAKIGVTVALLLAWWMSHSQNGRTPSAVASRVAARGKAGLDGASGLGALTLTDWCGGRVFSCRAALDAVLRQLLGDLG